MRRRLNGKPGKRYGVRNAKYRNDKRTWILPNGLVKTACVEDEREESGVLKNFATLGEGFFPNTVFLLLVISFFYVWHMYRRVPLIRGSGLLLLCVRWQEERTSLEDRRERRRKQRRMHNASLERSPLWAESNVQTRKKNFDDGCGFYAVVCSLAELFFRFF